MISSLYYRFVSHEKTWEVRRLGKQWTRNTIIEGRRVEFREPGAYGCGTSPMPRQPSLLPFFQNSIELGSLLYTDGWRGYPRNLNAARVANQRRAYDTFT
jgi:hypothetical protein